MTLLGGPYVFLGPALGAGILIVLNSVVTSFTEYWPVVLGVILLTLIYVFPAGSCASSRSRATPAAADDVAHDLDDRGAAMTATSLLEVTDVSRSFGGFQALGGVTLRVEPARSRR